MPLVTLKMADFAALAGQSFRLMTSPEQELRLAEIKGLGAAHREGGAFSLLFVGATGPFLPQATYRLAHPTLGTHDIFIVPIGRVEGGNGYEAIFT